MLGSIGKCLVEKPSINSATELVSAEENTSGSAWVPSECGVMASDSSISISCTTYTRPSDVIQDSTSVLRNDEIFETVTEFLSEYERLANATSANTDRSCQ